MPHFSQAGWDCYAVSLRGQGGSERPEGMKSGGSLASHAADLHSVVGSLPRAPVIIAHSFGGLLAQRCGVFGRISGQSHAGWPTLHHHGLWRQLAQSGGSLGLRQESMATRSLELLANPRVCGLQVPLAGRSFWAGQSGWARAGGSCPTHRSPLELLGLEMHVSLLGCARLWALAGHSNRADP